MAEALAGMKNIEDNRMKIAAAERTDFNIYETPKSKFQIGARFPFRLGNFHKSCLCGKKSLSL
ncbi:MAG: hypothetical protein WKF92_04370 [Pyrinomonadaceae bacterium]